MSMFFLPFLAVFVWGYALEKFVLTCSVLICCRIAAGWNICISLPPFPYSLVSAFVYLGRGWPAMGREWDIGLGGSMSVIDGGLRLVDRFSVGGQCGRGGEGDLAD